MTINENTNSTRREVMFPNIYLFTLKYCVIFKNSFYYYQYLLRK